MQTTKSFRYANMMFSLLEDYKEEVEASSLAPSSKVDYKMFAEFFVRWLVGEFTPGSNVK